MIKTITDYQSLTLSMIRVPKFQQTVEDNINVIQKRINKEKKHVPGKKKLFFRGGLDFFSNFRGGLTKKCAREGGVLINIHFQGEQLYVGGISFFWGVRLRGVLTSMVTLPLFHLHFQNMSLTSCQTKFSQLQKMLLVSHKRLFVKTRLCIYA